MPLNYVSKWWLVYYVSFNFVFKWWLRELCALEICVKVVAGEFLPSKFVSKWGCVYYQTTSVISSSLLYFL